MKIAPCFICGGDVLVFDGMNITGDETCYACRDYKLNYKHEMERERREEYFRKTPPVEANEVKP